MTRPIGWTVSVSNALRAHFKQPSGLSRAGADWSVSLVNGAEQRRVFVRAYADEVGKLPAQDESRLVAAFVEGLLEKGWMPDQYGGAPGELVVPRQAGVAVKSALGERPWWRFW
jgi:hypothetical protein